VAEIRLRIISLGAGVQSTTMALMAARRDIGPMPDGAIFADTGAEPSAVYRHLDWLERQLPFPVYRVSAGNLRDEILGAMGGTNRMDARPPFFTSRKVPAGTRHPVYADDGEVEGWRVSVRDEVKEGMLNRQCTQDFKIIPIERKIRELLGLHKGQRGPKEPIVEQWIGISGDEAIRMKPSRLSYVKHRWPLIEASMTRAACLRWNQERQYPRPPKSACTFCPYHDDRQWRELRDNDPEAFADAVAIDAAIRPGMPGPKRPPGDSWWIHRSRKPLAEVDLRTDAEAGQPDLFGNECEGMCGV
jgi:hypothetical protein